MPRTSRPVIRATLFPVWAALVLGLASAGCTGQIGGDSNEGGPDSTIQCDKGPRPLVRDAQRLTVNEYKNVILDLFGPTVAPSDKYPGSYGKSATGYSTEPALYNVGDQTVESLMEAAENVAESVAASLPTLLPCSVAPDAGAECAGEFIDEYAQRAYRRPLTDDERAALLETYQGGRDSGASFTEAIAMVTSHVLQTPQFLYLVEGEAPGGRQLDGYEMASRLSFFLWETLPDEALLADAASGALQNAEVRRAHAERMLADPRADGVLRRFFREWTQTTDVAPGDKDPTLVPGFDDAYAASMADSFDRFAVEQARTGTLATLLTSKSVWVDSKMASFYGVPAPGGSTEIAIDDLQSGLATQPLFLASAAHYGDTSYVFRGRFIRKRLLCSELGAPPADAQAQFDAIQKPQDPTGKDLSAAVTADAACASCHAQIDPGGLSLEGFGALGEHRASYPSGKPIDPSGVLGGIDGGDIAFSSYADMFATLASQPSVGACFGKQVFRFAMSRGDVEDDTCAVEEVGDIVVGGSGTLADAIVEMAASDSFAYRRD